MNPQEEILFKQKRDEYLVEIRKKKSSDLITAKRTKLTLDAIGSRNGINKSERIVNFFFHIIH